MLFPKLIRSALVLCILSQLQVSKVWGNSTMTTTGKVCNARTMKYLSQTEATALDVELFNDYKFSVDQLMELAGLSVASAIAKTFPAHIVCEDNDIALYISDNIFQDLYSWWQSCLLSFQYPAALVVCGPGNNGGDGLVAARHLILFGYNVSIYYPKRTPKPLYENLLAQCQSFGVDILEALPTLNIINERYNLLVDALFGFSFKPPVKAELKPVMDVLIDTNLPVCCVDIPSGWNVNSGPPEDRALKPALVISLSAPKICAKPEFLESAKHYLGGRFLPPAIIEKYGLILPPYPQQEQVVLINC